MRTVRRTLLPALTAITLSLTVTSCGADSDTGSADKVKFGYIADYNGASLLAIADKEGLWDKHGLDPEISVFTNGPVQIQALGAGDLDFGYIGPGAFWLPASGKAKIVAIDTLTVADRVVAQPGIDSVKDLKGQKVGVPEGTSGDMVLNLALRQAGMSIDDVDKVPMDPATIVTALVSGQIDAAGIWYPLLDSIKEKKPDLMEIASTKDFKDTSFPTAFVAGNKVKPELTEKVLSVLAEANDWRFENPDEAIAESAKLLKVTKEQVEADAANAKTLSTADLVAKTEDGTVDKWLNDMSEFFVSTGQLKEAPDPSTYYTGDLFTKAAAE